MGNTGAVLTSMHTAIEKTGYYPTLVSDCLKTAMGSQEPISFAVHHEATFDRDELRRHITVLALTRSRLIVAHVDEHGPDETTPVSTASASTESVRLDQIHSVVITRVVSNPAEYSPRSAPTEVVLTIGWGAVNRIELEPAGCGDPQCEADHGLTGSSSNDDLSVRMSVAADGHRGVEQLLAFAEVLADGVPADRHGNPRH